MATSGKSWEWHNTEVGVGYQAKHVVRQKTFAPITDKIIDMRGPVPKRISNCAGLSSTAVSDSTIRKCKSESPSTNKEGKVEKSGSLASIDKKKLKKMEKKSRRKEEKAAKAARKESRKEMRKEKKKE